VIHRKPLHATSGQFLLCYTEAMSSLFTDTDPQVEEFHIRLLRELPVWRKVEMFVELNASARLIAISGIRQRFPDADQSELQYRLAALLYGEEFALKTLGR
jgi:hypothetical protein